MSEDFSLLREYIANYETGVMLAQCKRWGDFFLTDEDRAALEKVPEAGRNEWKLEHIKPIIRPVWLLFVALCHALQESDYELTATDAYWLGLIDEVMGQSDLVNLRAIVETAFTRTDLADQPKAVEGTAQPAPDAPRTPDTPAPRL